MLDIFKRPFGLFSRETTSDSQPSAYDELRRLSLDVPFHRFEGRIKNKFGIEYDETKYPSYFSYVSSLFLVDMLDEAFGKKRIELPSHLETLDAGAGLWDYVHSLYDFLRNYGEPRSVNLVGVDIEGKHAKERVEKFIYRLPAEYLPSDIFKLNHKESYDLVFMAHMLTSRKAFRKWKIKYRPSSKLFHKLFEMLKPGGLFVGTAYLYAGEASIFNEFPADKKLLDWNYFRNLGQMTEFLSDYHTFDRNAIVLGRK